jgi:DNA-binding transcriptional regulator YiaG
MDLGISQRTAARQMEVSEDYLCCWENGRNQPQIRHYPSIIAFLGYYPFDDHETETFGGKIKRYKYVHGLNNEKLAEQLGVDETKVASWERNERKIQSTTMQKTLSTTIKNTSL